MGLTQKWNLARKMAKELGCPCTERDRMHVNRFLHQLHDIKRADAICRRMGVGGIDFSVKRQTLAEYLHNADTEERHDLLLHWLCAWQAAAIERRKMRRYTTEDT